jgi:hypothetical protein
MPTWRPSMNYSISRIRRLRRLPGVEKVWRGLLSRLKQHGCGGTLQRRPAWSTSRRMDVSLPCLPSLLIAV